MSVNSYDFSKFNAMGLPGKGSVSSVSEIVEKNDIIVEWINAVNGIYSLNDKEVRLIAKVSSKKLITNDIIWNLL